ncbi:MAG TPA: hypothetical protein VFM68_02770 [Candidatus Saccharimonadales bacterium]|nr:hypothetical protein [Candidatus Saccharimonadales bacterium]
MLDTKRRSSFGYVTSLVVTLISVGVALLLLVNRQYIIDQVYAWQYQPTDQISAFAERTDMSDTGKFLFYASQPELENAQEFNTECSRIEQGTAILGCYDGRKIYIYNVTNPRLDGIRAVTSAHEMLHAAYIRLDDSERTQLDKLLEVEYDKLKDTADFSERMAFYARTEPGERYNELHSIIGTEVKKISPELEEHYARYFNDRSKVVQLHLQYASVFAALQARSQELSRQLNALADAIESSSAAYNRNVNQLNQDIAQFNARANNGDFSSQTEFESERAALEARANTLDSQRAAISSDRARYNELREELLLVASESEALNRSIDSSLAPSPSI